MAHVLVFGTFVTGALFEVLDHVLELLLLLLVGDYGSWVDLLVLVGLWGGLLLGDMGGVGESVLGLGGFLVLYWGLILGDYVGFLLNTYSR